MAYEFKLPDIGEGIHEGEIVQWLVKAGDAVQEDQPIVEIMTDKVTAEIPAPVSGVISNLQGQPGQVVKVGSVIATFDESGSPSVQAPKAAAQNTTAEAPPAKAVTVNGPAQGEGVAVQARPSAVSRSGKFLAAPATRKMARALDVDLSRVIGTGPKGRITPQDVKNFQPSQPQGVPSNGKTSSANGFQGAGERRAPFGGLRRKIGEHLVKSKQTAPHFAYVEEVDMSKLVAMRADLMPLAEAEGVKLSYLPFVIKAVIAGLRKFPMLNAQLDEATQEIIYKNDYHIGVAVATDQGLIVPVVKFSDQKNLFALAQEIKQLAEKARSGKLSLDELKGGTFTLTSIGSIGGLFGIPIINYPEVGIMGINKIEKRPVVREIDGQDQIVIREMMHLSISADHRVVDGAEAALFVKEVIQYLENPGRLIATL